METIWAPSTHLNTKGANFVYLPATELFTGDKSHMWLVEKKNPEQDINVQGTMLSGTVQVLRKVLKNWHGHLREDDFPLRQTEVYRKSPSKKVHGMTAP